MTSARERHATSPGEWPADFPVDAAGRIEAGLVVRSLSGEIEGRTTGARLRCSSLGCPGWFIGVTWETGQLLKPCSEGWHYDARSKSIRITAGGEISARFISPAPLGPPPLPREEWLDRAELQRRKGWRANGDASIGDDAAG
jgi:hypothetical protein